jgi:hypothetical protein
MISTYDTSPFREDHCDCPASRSAHYFTPVSTPSAKETSKTHFSQCLEHLSRNTIGESKADELVSQFLGSIALLKLGMALRVDERRGIVVMVIQVPTIAM